MPLISIIVGYRDRELERVGRFLQSIDAQSFRDFELIFVDYGSREELSADIFSLCLNYSWCRYLFNNARGRFWNRSHALNSGLKNATGEYVLFTDIDLIYSVNVLAKLSLILSPDTLIFHKAYFLPEDFSEYVSLESLPLNFPLSKMTTLGLFQCVSREKLVAIRGYDEYYAIWGPEDRDLVMRLQADSVVRHWMDERETPIYHQWHPPSVGNDIIHKSFWWDKMWLHYGTYNNRRVTNPGDWGHVYTLEDRAILVGTPFTTITIPSHMHAFQRARVIEEILFFLNNYGDNIFEIKISYRQNAFNPTFSIQSRSARLSRLLNTANNFLRGIRMPFRLASLSLINIKLRMNRPYEESIIPHMFFMIFELKYSLNLISDYSWIEDRETTIVRLKGLPN